ncbi:hypothetical protein J056_002779 [Wallemia ichthyophaga EXF-994]|uniref:Uncharacterized protein n=2 Tax=Wallemia ichthyophaga TaxID=245174 RepID=R9A9H8_WALI9|nr:uncharacterized protein J056_002779 [Wallemia ichthyophaga EXF-994]EOQ98826.1 hypothetical protein J056_002779 [Wallemia ichthyophaga EXF-994]
MLDLEAGSLPTGSHYRESMYLTGYEEIDFSPVQRQATTLSVMQEKLNRTTSIALASIASKFGTKKPISRICKLFKTPTSSKDAESAKDKTFEGIPMLDY